GRHSMGTFMPGARISQAHGTVRPVDPATGAASALVFAMYHPAAALRTPAIERESYTDIAAVPSALIDARRRRETTPEQPTEPEAPETTDPLANTAEPDADRAAAPTAESAAADAAPQLTLF